jgi:hypothetical protein
MALNITNHGGGKSIAQTPTLTLTAYNAGDCMGGMMTFNNATRQAGGLNKINSVRIIDNHNIKAQLEIWLFDAAVTFQANHAAMSFSAADMQHWIGVLPVASADYTTLGAVAGANPKNLGLEYTLPGMAIYGQLKCVATPTYTAVDDLTIKIDVEFLDNDVLQV